MERRIEGNELDIEQITNNKIVILYIFNFFIKLEFKDKGSQCNVLNKLRELSVNLKTREGQM